MKKVTQNQKQQLISKLQNNDILDLTLIEMFMIKKMHEQDSSFEHNFDEYVVNDLVLGLDIILLKHNKQQLLDSLNLAITNENYEEAADLRDLLLQY